jgi:hypothetical protein
MTDDNEDKISTFEVISDKSEKVGELNFNAILEQPDDSSWQDCCDDVSVGFRSRRSSRASFSMVAVPTWKEVDSDEDDEADVIEINDIDSFREHRHPTAPLPEIHEQIPIPMTIESVSNPAKDSNVNLNEISSKQLNIKRNWGYEQLEMSRDRSKSEAASYDEILEEAKPPTGEGENPDPSKCINTSATFSDAESEKGSRSRYASYNESYDDKNSYIGEIRDRRLPLSLKVV